MGLKVNYKGSQLTSMDETGTKTLLTNGKYCEDNFEVIYEGSGSSGYTATVDMEDIKTGVITYASCSIKYNNVYKISNFNYEANDTLTFKVNGGDYAYSYLYINNNLVASAYDSFGSQTYNYTLPSSNIQIKGYYISSGSAYNYYTYVTIGNPLEISEYGSYIADPSAPYDSVIISSSEPTDAVRFFDYDGTLLYSYSKTQFLALSSMPANPSHTGLTAQGWNWSLSDAKAHVQNWNFLDIGQMYITSDGTTQIDIELNKSTLNIYLGISVDGTVSINWGDGSSASTVTGEGSTQTTLHEYNNEGVYTIKITVSNGNFKFFNSGNLRPPICINSSTLNDQYMYANLIKAIRIGNNCNIGTKAFYYCRSLSSITIPSSVTSIEDGAFVDCYNLSSVTIPSSVTSIEKETFDDCRSLSSITIPPSVTSIGDDAFLSCYNLSSITLSSSVISIGTEAFRFCYHLFRKIIPLYSMIDNYKNFLYKIPTTVTSIRRSAFENCYDLSSITIPSSVTSIGSYAFGNCYSLSSVIISSSVTSIGNYAFNYCYNLSSITIPSSVTSIGTDAFEHCYSLSSITLPSSIIAIKNSTFRYCYSLSSITIPLNVTSIENYAFDNCYSLQSITIPSSVTSIGSYAFRNCYSLSSVIISSSVTSIGSDAFRGCSGISEYHIQATIPPTLGTNVFTGIASNCKIYVPSASLSAYQSATNWSTYASQMVGE